ncbi:MAG: phosphoadenosine phosphosulfate reductase family protein [Acidimicrobiia bacterium]|nr:phosphoadenosine phosphosulfate reductase family protein [Acidimicrobiia bacterium]
MEDKRVKHVLGISGGKDSAALAIYLNNKYPTLDIEYYSCDTGKELKETYDLIDNLEIYLGKKINVLKAVLDDDHNPFDYFLDLYGGFLPSNTSRWCTKKMKLWPFEQYIAGDNPIVSYVGIRGDEDREGYISKKKNVQSIFPFRKNIWSEDVISLVLKNENITFITKLYEESVDHNLKDRMLEICKTAVSPSYDRKTKLGFLLESSVKEFNKVVYQFLKTTKYPLAFEDDFPLIENEDILIRDDIFKILEESGVGIPAYYKKKEYQVEIDGEIKTGYYARSRSGCFFCFFQQKIEWVWLYENHRELYEEAMKYEKEGYTWQQGESLVELCSDERREAIKREHYTRIKRQKDNFQSPNLVDILTDSSSDEWEIDWEEEEARGCAACFI